MSVIHVNPETGESGTCHAEIQCRFGGDIPAVHFENKQEANVFIEKVMHEKYGLFGSKRKKSTLDIPEENKKLNNMKAELESLKKSNKFNGKELDRLEMESFSGVGFDYRDSKEQEEYSNTFNETNIKIEQLQKDIENEKAEPLSLEEQQEKAEKDLQEAEAKLKRIWSEYSDLEINNAFRRMDSFDRNEQENIYEDAINQDASVQNLKNKVNQIKKDRTKINLDNDPFINSLTKNSADKLSSMIDKNTNEGDMAFLSTLKGSTAAKNPKSAKLQQQVKSRLKERINKNPAEWEQGQKAADSLVKRGSRSDYINSIDKKHFAENGMGGSKFTDTRVKKAEDVVSLALAQRGSLQGDDREKLIASGAAPNAFLPPESGVRYLQVKVDGTEATKSTADMPDDKVLTVQAKDPSDPNSSLSLVATVKEQPKTQFATVIIGPETDENKEPIKGTNTLWTMHPGAPTRGIRSNDLREKGLNGGSTITVKELREKFGKDIKANTKVVK